MGLDGGCASSVVLLELGVDVGRLGEGGREGAADPGTAREDLLNVLSQPFGTERVVVNEEAAAARQAKVGVLPASLGAGRAQACRGDAYLVLLPARRTGDLEEGKPRRGGRRIAELGEEVRVL